MSTPDILNVLPVEGTAMEEDLSFEFGFNSHENLLRIAERKARFRQAKLSHFRKNSSSAIKPD